MKFIPREKNKNGFTLIEMVTVMAILGVSIFTFYTVFILNWSTLNNFITRADLLQEMDKIVDEVSKESRNAAKISPDVSQKILRLLDANNVPKAQYTINNLGEFIVSKSGQVSRFSQNVDFTLSNFQSKGKAVLITIVMRDTNFGKNILIQSSTEIYPRN